VPLVPIHTSTRLLVKENSDVESNENSSESGEESGE